MKIKKKLFADNHNVVVFFVFLSLLKFVHILLPL